MTTVRTRFAPSPTGFQHIGGFRTAMYAWLLAKSNGGEFILRIEDTDQERLVPGAVRYLIESMQWLGISYDEGPGHKELKKIGEYWDGAPDVGGPYGPYIQSLRKERYREVAEDLVARGVAYRCDCTPERLEQERAEQLAKKEDPGYSGFCRTRAVSKESKHVIRLKIPAKVSLTLLDAVRGKITWEAPSLKDPVLLKSDGLPLYHLASVVDDHDMRISHVIRGEEWLPTTPIHILLYQALDWKIPTFCHVSQVLGSDGKKLSKRHGADSIDKYRDAGYLPQALLNYVVLVGWNPGAGEEQEVFSAADLIKRFTLDGLSSAGGIFDTTKLQWMNGVYIRKLPAVEFAVHAKEQIEKAGLKFNPERWAGMAPHIQERTKLLPEIPPLVDYLFQDQITRDLPAMAGKGLEKEKVPEVLRSYISKAEALPEFSLNSTEEAARKTAEEFGLKIGPVCMVLRIAISGRKVSPPLFESMLALGREESLRRLRDTLALVPG